MPVQEFVVRSIPSGAEVTAVRHIRSSNLGKAQDGDKQDTEFKSYTLHNGEVLYTDDDISFETGPGDKYVFVRWK